jgi:hypothetical protein
VTRTRVYLTVDVECSEERMVGGRLRPPLGYDLRVWGRGERGEDLGIGLIMRELAAERLAATFFVEPFGAEFFGRDGLARVIADLRARGHDVQFHAHPVQRRADFLSRGEPPAPDNLADYPTAQQAELLGEGLDILVACGVPRAELRGFRAGNFGANNDTWRAMHQVGLTVSSNYNPCYLRKSCRVDWPRPEPSRFDTGCGVWELPVSNFCDPDGGFRHLQVTAASLGEMTDYLQQARRLGLGEVTIVTHSFEHYHLDQVAPPRLRKNRVNLARLRGLIRFLGQNRGAFEVETVGALAARVPAPTVQAGPAPLPAGGTPVVPRGSRLRKAGRLIEQAYKRAEAKIPL